MSQLNANISISFQGLADNLDQAIGWLRNLGIPVSNTRVAQYHRAMSDLAEHFQKGTLSQLFPASEPTAAQDYLSYFYEAGEIISIHSELSKITDSRFNSQLKKFVRGPHFTSAENKTSAFPRDTAFELLIAAQLMRLGLPPESLPPADMMFKFKGKNIVLECKRPTSPKLINRRVKEGFKQIHNRVKSGLAVRIRGIVAIDMSKTINPDNKQFWVDTGNDVGRTMTNLIDKVVAERRQNWSDNKQPRSIGVLIRVAVMLLVRETNIPVYCQQYGYVKLHGLGQLDNELSNSVGQYFSRTPQLQLMANKP